MEQVPSELPQGQSAALRGSEASVPGLESSWVQPSPEEGLHVVKGWHQIRGSGVLG